MAIYLEQRLASALHMAECADSICARNSHLRLARLYRLRLTTMQAVSQGRQPSGLRGSATTVPTRMRVPGEPGVSVLDRPEHCI